MVYTLENTYRNNLIIDLSKLGVNAFNLGSSIFDIIIESKKTKYNWTKSNRL